MCVSRWFKSLWNSLGTPAHVDRVLSLSRRIVSAPLPPDHWSRVPADLVPPMPMRCGTSLGKMRDEFARDLTSAVRYAYRACTMGGRYEEIDPDALVQNVIVGMLGYWTSDGLSADEQANPWPVPDHLPAPSGKVFVLGAVTISEDSQVSFVVRACDEAEAREVAARRARGSGYAGAEKFLTCQCSEVGTVGDAEVVHALLFSTR